MKNIKFLIALIALVTCTAVVTSCNKGECCHSTNEQGEHKGCSHAHGEHEHSHEKSEDKAYTSAYICPMYCEGSGSTEAGECPVCHMDYVPNKNHQ